MNVYSNKLSLMIALSDFVEDGVDLYLKGEPSSPEYTADVVMESGGVYMADFVRDDDGNLKEIRYDEVSLT